MAGSPGRSLSIRSSISVLKYWTGWDPCCCLQMIFPPDATLEQNHFSGVLYNNGGKLSSVAVLLQNSGQLCVRLLLEKSIVIRKKKKKYCFLSKLMCWSIFFINSIESKRLAFGLLSLFFCSIKRRFFRTLFSLDCPRAFSGATVCLFAR